MMREIRMKRLVRQFLKFGVVGSIAFLIDYGILMLLNVGLGVHAVIAAAVSFIVSVVFNYFASMRYVFTHRDDLTKAREFVIFVVLSVIGLVLNEICMAIGISYLGDTPFLVTVTKVLATLVVTIWNFISRSRWLDAGDSL
jgi:putative flippase GtrA